MSIKINLHFYLSCNGKRAKVVPLKQESFQIPRDCTEPLYEVLQRNFKFEHPIGIVFFQDFELSQVNSPFLSENYVTNEKDHDKTLCVFRRVYGQLGKAPQQLTTDFLGYFAHNGRIKMQTFVNPITLGFFAFFLKNRYFKKNHEEDDPILFFSMNGKPQLSTYYNELSDILDPTIRLTSVYSVEKLLQAFPKDFDFFSLGYGYPDHENNDEKLMKSLEKLEISGVLLESYYSIPGLKSFPIFHGVLNKHKIFCKLLTTTCLQIEKVADNLGGSLITSSAIVRCFEKDQETPFYQKAVTIKQCNKAYFTENPFSFQDLEQTLGANYSKLNKIEIHITPEKICVHCSKNVGTTRCEFNEFCENYICESPSCKSELNHLPVCRNHEICYTGLPVKKLITITIKYYTGFVFDTINVVSRSITVPVNTNIRQYLLEEMRNETPGHVGHFESWAVWRNSSIAKNDSVNFTHHNIQLMHEDGISITNARYTPPYIDADMVSFSSLPHDYSISVKDHNRTFCVFRDQKSASRASHDSPHLVEFSLVPLVPLVPQGGENLKNLKNLIKVFFNGGSTFGHVFYYLEKTLFQGNPSEIYKYLVLLEKNKDAFCFPALFATFKLSKFIFPVVTKIHLYSLPTMTKQMNSIQPKSQSLMVALSPNIKLNIVFAHPFFDTHPQKSFKDSTIVERNIDFCHQTVEEQLIQCYVDENTTVSDVIDAIKKKTDLFQTRPWLNTIQCVVSNNKVILPWEFKKTYFTPLWYRSDQEEFSVVFSPILVCQPCNTKTCGSINIARNKLCVSNPFVCIPIREHHKQNLVLCKKCTYYHPHENVFCCFNCVYKDVNNYNHFEVSKLGARKSIMKKSHFENVAQKYFKEMFQQQ